MSHPYSFERTASAAGLRRDYGELGAGAETGVEVAVAGRIRTVRHHGRIGFADLVDATGRIQLFVQHAAIGDGMNRFSQLSVGDIVGVRGEVVVTRRGELSVRVAHLDVLAKCERPWPDEWHGMTDVEARYRQRYLDFAVNDGARKVVGMRARAGGAIRRWLDERGFIEVETPLLQPVAGGATARPFVTHLNALGIDLYLRVAPELYLKRLLIAGFDKVYELNRNFRNEGVSTRHLPEFTMLEAYEAYADYDHTMTVVEELVRELARAVTGSLRFSWGGMEVDLEPPFSRMTMFEAIEQHTGTDLTGAWMEGDAAAVIGAARAAGIDADDSKSPGKAVAEIYEHRVEKAVVRPTFVTGFPKDVSPLARDHRSIPGFTEHADLLICGIEIAPVYSELNDPAEQRRRFRQQAAARAAGDDEAQVADEDFLEALCYGMPPAGGFGLGVDRLLMLLGGMESIREAVLFPTLRPLPADAPPGPR